MRERSIELDAGLRTVSDLCTIFVVFPLLVLSYSLLMALGKLSTATAMRVESSLYGFFVLLVPEADADGALGSRAAPLIVRD